MEAVILINLGTPKKPTYLSVFKFLTRFLQDKRVVKIPALLWRPLLYGLIAPLRAYKSSKKYQLIWTDKGSPLLVNTIELADKLAMHLSHQMQKPIPVISAMTYGTPSLQQALLEIKRLNISRLIVLPLFPQYAEATTAAAFDAMTSVLKKETAIPSICWIHEYALEEVYLTRLAMHVKNFWKTNPKGQKILFSFHGIPERRDDLGKPYESYPSVCREMAERLADILKLDENMWKYSFQSRFGYAKWVGPYTDETLIRWAKSGVETVDVIAPSFAVDCLETTEELAIQSRDKFLSSGGKVFQYVPAMNVSDEHVEALGDIILNFYKKKL